METAVARAQRQRAGGQPVVLDALVIGAGVAGLYELYQLRRDGLTVAAVDTASDVGGTWYWNRYPGAKFDSESYIYQYLFDEELYKGWTWSERFPAQPEIERWMHYIADRLDLRKDILFSTTVTSAEYDAGRGRWTVRTKEGDVFDTQFLIGCTGMHRWKTAFRGRPAFTARSFTPPAGRAARCNCRASASASSASARRGFRSSRPSPIRWAS